MAIEWTYADFQAVAPDLSAVSSAVFDRFALFAGAQISRARFSGQRLILAGCYLTAHLLSISTPAGIASPAGGPVSSESVGGLSVSYAIKPFGADDLALSRYGIAFAHLARAAGAGGVAP